MVQTFVTLHNSAKAQALAQTCNMITCPRLIIGRNCGRLSGAYQVTIQETPTSPVTKTLG
jgi:hypothetical protein